MNHSESLGASLAAPAMAAASAGVASSSGVLASQTEIAGAPLRPEDDALLKHIPTQGALKGERYDALVPNTLDLAERLRLSLIALTNMWFPQARWAGGFFVTPGRPFAMKGSSPEDTWLCITFKFIEGIVYGRLASGSNLNLEVDRKIIASRLGLIGNDGFSYPAPAEVWPEVKSPRDFWTVYTEGRALSALTQLAQLDDDSRWEELARKKVDGLLSYSREKDGFRYFGRSRFMSAGYAGVAYSRGETVPLDAPELWGPSNWLRMCTEKPLLTPCDHGGYQTAECVGAAYGTALFYRLTGYRPALELSRGMARWGLTRIFNRPDGRWLVWHGAGALLGLIGLASYAEAAEDDEVFRRADACYRWYRDLGDPLLGWYVPYMPGSEAYEKWTPPQMEGCCGAHMMFLAALLSRQGIGDYWDDVDRFVRNYGAACQLADLDLLERIPETYLSSPHASAQCDTREIAARALGAFLCALGPNDGFPVSKRKDGGERATGAVAGCCTGNGARGLYAVWESIVTGVENDVRVNLLLNRASEWVDVASYLPAEGKVVVKVKRTNRVKVRMPEWIALDDVAVFLNGHRAEAKREGRYLGLASLSPRDEIVIRFPVPERTVNRVIAYWPYRLTLRGANVVAIDPPGRALPLFHHQPPGKLVSRERFLSARKLSL